MLKAIPRKPGTRHAKKLRLQGLIPVSIQGEGKPHADLAIDEREFLAARRHHEHLFDIDVEGGAAETALIRELQWDTTSDRILHVEFRRVVRGKKTEVEVELVFQGHPKGGVTNHLVTHVTVLALPSQIPDELVVPMGDTHPGDVVHVRDIRIPEGVELVTDADTPVANVAVPRGVEETTEEAAEAAPEGGQAEATPHTEE